MTDKTSPPTPNKPAPLVMFILKVMMYSNFVQAAAFFGLALAGFAEGWPVAVISLIAGYFGHTSIQYLEQRDIK